MNKPRFLPCCNIRTRNVVLVLSLPEGCDGDNWFYCNDEYDLDVPDAEIEIDAQKLLNALDAYQLHRNTFDSVCICIDIDSDGYEGKLRRDQLKIISCPGVDGFWTNAQFCNDWTGSNYWFDTDPYWPVPMPELRGYLRNLLQL